MCVLMYILYICIDIVPIAVLTQLCPMVYYKSLIFFLIAYSGYVQDVTKVQQSQRSSNLCYDVMFQMSATDSTTIRVMHQRGDGNKSQLFLDKMAAGQPIRLSNMPVATGGTVLLNKVVGTV